jgi:hypothetical protein
MLVVDSLTMYIPFSCPLFAGEEAKRSNASTKYAVIHKEAFDEGSHLG